MLHKLSYLLLFFIVSAVATAVPDCHAEAKHTEEAEEVRFFASYEASREKFIVGDSLLVNVVVYSSAAFQNVELLSRSPKAKGGTMRLLPGRGLQQQRVRTADGLYYAIVLQRYIVSSQDVGTLTLPEMKFSGEFVIYDEPEEQFSPFDPFGFFRQTPRKSHKVKQKCKAESMKLQVVPKPKRSTQEVISSGTRVA